MKYSVVGRETDGMFVLFDLGDGVYAAVTQDGNVTYSIGWIHMTKFVTIDTRGTSAIPAEELRSAIFALKNSYDGAKVEELKNEAMKEPETVEFNDVAQQRYGEMIDRLPRNPDGSLRLFE